MLKKQQQPKTTIFPASILYWKQ